MVSPQIREALVERVERRVTRRGVSRAAIAAAVDRVLTTLEAREARSVATDALVVLASTVHQDLASRTRQALAARGVVPSDAGAATVGRHTVVTLRVSDEQRAVVEDVARQLGATVSVEDQAFSGSAS
jgi:hypothetical protein